MHFILLDGYRGMAAIIVLLFHAALAIRSKELIPYGSLAVDFFYCLSGFVICHSYQARLSKGMSLGEFVRVRLVRLYPMIAIGLLIGLGFFILRLALSHKWERLGAGLASFFLNALFLPSPFTELANGASWPINGAHWSLSFELLANIVFAAVLVHLSRFLFTALTAIAFLVLAYFALQIPEFDVGWGWADLWFGVIRVMYPFMAGVVVYWAFLLCRGKVSITSPTFGIVVSMALCASLVVPSGILSGNWYPILFVGAIAPTLVLAGALYTPTTAQSAVFNVLGKLSFPLYAVHLPLVRFAQGVGERAYPNSEVWRISLVVVSCLAAIPLAWACQRYLEPPVRTYLSKLMRTKSSGPQSV